MSYQSRSRGAEFRRFLFLLILLAGVVYLGYRYFLFFPDKDLLPAGSSMAGVDIGLITAAEAEERVRQAYTQPVFVQHRESQVELTPESVGFQIDMVTMRTELDAYVANRPVWQSFSQHLLKDFWPQPVMPAQIELVATHNPELLQQMVASVAGYLDVPAQQPHIIPVTLNVNPGTSGFRTEISSSLPAVEAAFYQPTNRTATLQIVPEESEVATIDLLEEYVATQISSFSGSGSYYILDLQTGEEILINADKAMSGTSTVKIAIMLETYRAREQLGLDQRKLISETMTLSGNYSANLLLDVVAGVDNAYLGSDILTESLWNLGLVNTFIATPYEEPARFDVPTRITPANSSPTADIIIDQAMQTTAEDIGALLSMIYHCSQGGGALLVVYPEQLTPQECQEMLSYMSLNFDGNWLIRDGLPPDTLIAHKHGWIDGNAGFHGTHSDAAVVFSPGGDFIIVGYLYDEGWLDWELTGPIMRSIARATYNYFNPDEPYTVNVDQIDSN